MTVTAEFRDQNGNLLWKENPYPYKRKFAIGQTYPRDDKEYEIIAVDFIGKLNDGDIYYIVKPVNNWRRPERAVTINDAMIDRALQGFDTGIGNPNDYRKRMRAALEAALNSPVLTDVN